MPKKLGENIDEKPVVTITPDGIAELVVNNVDAEEVVLLLDDLTNLDVPVANAMPRDLSILHLNGLTQLDVPVANAMPRDLSILHLNGLTQLDVPVAEALPRGLIAIGLNGLIQIDVPVAEALPRGLTDIRLNGLTQIDASIAATLGGLIGGRWAFVMLSLEGLKHIDCESALHLRWLWINNMLAISDEVDACFTEYELIGYEDQPDVAVHWQPLFEKHSNFKDIVVEESTEVAQYLKENGVSHAERFHNLNAGMGAYVVIDEALHFIHGQSNGFGTAAFAKQFKDKIRKDFEGDSEFMRVYLDETLQTLLNHLNNMVRANQWQLKDSSNDAMEKRKTYLEGMIADSTVKDKVRKRYRRDLKAILSRNTQSKTIESESRISHARELLSKMSSFHLRRQGEVSYQLGSRSTRDLTWGDKCSDCTSAKIHGMNFWTVPTWITDPGFNFLLQYDEEGKLAHKFGLVWELKSEDGKQVPILTIDSLELANEQKPKAGMYAEPENKKKEEMLMKDAVAFIRNWAKDMGLDSNNLFASTISNTGVAELDQKYPKKYVTITKLAALDAPQRILKRTNPDYMGEAKVYLQSLSAYDEVHFVAEDDWEDADEANYIERDVENEVALEEGNRASDFAEVEGCIDEFLRSDSNDSAKIREFMELSRTDSETAARQMRIFLITQAQKETKEALTVEGKRIDAFLNSRGHSLEAYLKVIHGQTEISRGVFVQAYLFHLVPKSD